MACCAAGKETKLLIHKSSLSVRNTRLAMAFFIRVAALSHTDGYAIISQPVEIFP